ncbi:MAG: response regulator transcription factor, partial [Coriobacteriales bacterium]|nr:response regulator transcription factor [Coriobacteriales bacterium]
MADPIILVVDDDVAIAEAIEIYLRGEGYRVRLAHDGLQALEAVRREPIDLIVMDVMMPGLDGIHATMRIREEHPAPIPILMLSAKSEDLDKICGLNIGADDYVTKPFNPLELLARVRALLRRSQLGQGDGTRGQGDGGPFPNSPGKRRPAPNPRSTPPTRRRGPRG